MRQFGKLLEKIRIPSVHEIRRTFPDNAVRDIPFTVHQELSRIKDHLPAGGEIAVCVGSRGIANIVGIVAETVRWFREQGTRPFVIPAMGSHGGASSEGQLKVLEHLGITEQSIGCEIRSCMDVVELEKLPCGLPVYADALASKADGIFVVNRIKRHAAFSGRNESGLVKMLAIGLGKQKGAESTHALGYGHFSTVMPQMASVLLRSLPVLGGLGIVENAYDDTCRIACAPAAEFLDKDAELLDFARSCMPGLPVPDLDVLLVQRMGKDIAGSGVDPDVVCRAPTPYKHVQGSVSRVGVLRLTDASSGNATGMGLVDVISRNFLDAINHEYTYTNVMTSTLLKSAFTPVVMPDDESVLRCLIKTCNAPDMERIRLAYIRDTLTLDRMWVSESVAETLRGQKDISISSMPVDFAFDASGNLVAPGW